MSCLIVVIQWKRVRPARFNSPRCYLCNCLWAIYAGVAVGFDLLMNTQRAPLLSLDRLGCAVLPLPWRRAVRRGACRLRVRLLLSLAFLSVFLSVFGFSFCWSTSLSLCGQFRWPSLVKATTASKATLPIANSACGLLVCPKEGLTMLGIFNVRTNVNACDCTQVCSDIVK